MFCLKLNVSPQIFVNLIEVTLLKVFNLFIYGTDILYEQNSYTSKTNIYLIIASYYSCNNYNKFNVLLPGRQKCTNLFLTTTFTPFKYSTDSTDSPKICALSETETSLIDNYLATLNLTMIIFKGS